MKTSQLAPWANLGGALSPKHFASFNVVGIFSHVLPKSLASKLRKLILIGSCWLVTTPVFASFAVTLAWDANPETDLVGYKLSYGTASGAYTNVISTGLVTEISVPNLVEGTTYYFAVAAVNAAGAQSLNSNEVSYSFTTSGTVVPPTVVTTSPTGKTVIYVDSEDPTEWAAALAVDGNPNTFWHTLWNVSNPPVCPHEIQVSLGTEQTINGFGYLPRQDNYLNGTVGQYEFYVSTDGTNWGSPVATGTFPNTHDLKEVRFAQTSAKFIRFRSLADANPGSSVMSVAELNVIQDPVVPPIVVVPQITNQAPVATNESLTVNEDTPLNLVLQGTDTNGDTLTYSLVNSPTRGQLTGVAPNLTYTPAPNDYGTDSLTFVVNDGQVTSAVATVLITILPVNDSPVAIAKTVTTAQNSSVTITLDGSDPEGDLLTGLIVTAPTNGTASVTGRQILYTPGVNYSGDDQITFRLNDGGASSAAATISITVVPPIVVVPQITNQAPVATNESLTVNEDTPLNLVLQGTDTNGDTLTYSLVNSPTRGQLTGVAPNLTYTPAPNDYGTDSLTFVVNDGQVTSAVATVLITILPVNDSPVAIAKTVTTAQNSSVTITLDGSDPEGDLLTGLIVTAPTNGTASVTGRQILYTPGVNYSGDDQITFRLNDGGASSAAATISITVVAPTIVPIVAAVQAPATPITVSVTTPPLPWNTANIGVGQAPGSLLYSQGDFVQTGAGALGGTTDKLNFIYQPLTGDGQITVKISANQKIGYSGISIRESLAPNARKIFLGVNSSNNHVMVSRSTTAAKNYVKSLTSNSTTQQWIRLVRNYKKSYFYAYSSSDGVTWRLIGSKLIKMSNTCQVGLSVCSGNDTTTTTSTFSSVVAIP